MLAAALATFGAFALPQSDEPPLVGDLATLLARSGTVLAVAPEDLSRPAGLEGLDLLVWDTRSRELPAAMTDPAAVATVRAWVEDGGQLLLLSHATRWLWTLGAEDVPPDRCDTRLLGDRDRYRGGSYDYGLQVADPGHPLFAGLAPLSGHSDVFLLEGGHAVRNESCFWENTTPVRARVLGTFWRTAYGEERAFAHRCLVAVDVGAGRALAYGCGPLATADNPHADNLARFLSNAVAWLDGSRRAGSEPTRVGLLPPAPARLGVDAYSSRPPAPTPAPHSWERTGPHLPYIAHWGWHGQVDYQRAGRASVDLEYFRTRIVDESAAWGANLLEFYPPDMQNGFPYAWPEDDPIPRPERYWGGSFDPAWDEARTRELVAYAHDRGFLVHSFNHPNPVRGPPDEFVAYAERTARDLANPLLYGARRALDGFGTEWFPSDRDARITAALWSYDPGLYQHSTAVLPAYTPNFSGTKMCAFGRLGSLVACGFSDAWRNLYHPPLYLSYQADCRTRKPSAADWGSWSTYGGGSYPDWVLRQVNDFCRDRLAADSAIWWLGEPEATLHPEYREYVYGVSMDPIRCAVACALWSTGRGGYRETLAALGEDPPPGFASGPETSFRTAILQNNYLRLSRGPDGAGDATTLRLDPLRLARFDPEPDGRARAKVLLQRARPAPGVAVDESVLELGAEDGSAAEGRPEGDYGLRFSPADGTLPRRVAYEATPKWPTALRLGFAARVGRHRLQVGARPEVRASVLEVRLDGEPIGFYVTGARAGAGAADRDATSVHAFEFDVVEPGRHELEVSVQSGAGHELDFVRVHRVRTGAVRRSFPSRAGVVASLLETVAVETSSGVEREELRFELVADRPALDVEVRSGGPGFGTAAGFHGAFGTDLVDALDASTVVSTPTSVFGRHRDAGVWLAARWSEVRDESADGAGRVTRASIAAFDAHDGAVGFVDGAAPPGASARAVPAADRGSRDRPTYLVRELDADGSAWWTTRGAQPAGEVDLVKVYDRPGAAARVSIDDYLPSGFRPGWGCQHALAFTDAEQVGACTVRVEKVGPFLFAPRVEFERPLRAVRVDGRDWRYFDDRVVFLPNAAGTYWLEVDPAPADATAGEPPAPTVTRTFLTVRHCLWDAGRLTLTLVSEPPVWFTRPLPGGQSYAVMVHTAGLRLLEARGAEPIPLDSYRVRDDGDRASMRARGLVLRLQPGTATLRFAR